jgi:hypothetical protein
MPELKPSYSSSWVDWLMAEYLTAQGQAGKFVFAKLFITIFLPGIDGGHQSDKNQTTRKV